MIVRRFRESGIQLFKAFLARARLDPGTPIPQELLEDECVTEVVEPRIDIEWRNLVTKADAANQLGNLFAPLMEADVANDAGLWTWLSLFYFDVVCPPKKGVRKIRNDYSYVFEPKNSRHFYRHLLFIAWRILRVAPEHNRLLLCSSVSSLDKVTSEVMKRLFLTRIPCIFEVLDRLYWDENKGRPRVGITRPTIKPGDLVHRFPIRVRQLEMTYDLNSLNADQLIQLLGDEFQQRPQNTLPEPLV